jgi:electron transfer flavoprotein beta subunit
MANMRALMPALQKSKPATLATGSLTFQGVTVPSQKRETRVLKDLSAAQVAQELAAWIKAS